MNILPMDKRVAVVGMLTEGMSILSTARLTGVNKNTTMRLGVYVGYGCLHLHDRLMRNLEISRLELDELWSFVGKKYKEKAE